MLDEIFDDEPAEDDIPPDIPPEPLSASAVVFAYVGVITSLVISLTLNIYHDSHADTAAANAAHAAVKADYHPLPMGIAVLVGIGIPLLCGVLSHLGAEVDSNRMGKLVIYAIVAALMFVSAKAGTSVLEMVLGFAAAVIASVAVDSAAMYCLHTLMKHQERKKALKQWEAGQAERQRQATEKRRQRANAVTAARNSGGRRTVTPRDNTPAGGSDNTPARSSITPPRVTVDNTLPGDAGSTPAKTAQAAGVVLAEGQERSGNVTPITRRQEQATVAAPGKRRGKTDEEILGEMEELFEHCIATGENFGTNAYRRRYGGSPNRVGPLINKFLESRETPSEDAAAGGEEGAG